MVELVDAACQLVDISADQVGSGGLECVFQGGAKLGDGQHQILGVGVGRCLNGQVLPGAVLCQNGLDAHDGVEDIGAGVAFKGGKAVHVKDIVLGGLVAQVAVFQGSQSDFGSGGFHLVILHNAVFHHLGPDEIGHVLDQLLQAHHTALTGLEGLAVLAVHGAEAQVGQGEVRRNDAALFGSPEHLLKVQSLALVGDVKHFIGVEVLHPLDHGCQVGGGVDGGAVGLDQNTRGNFLLVGLLCHGDDPGALALDSQTLLLKVLHHGGDVGIGIAFSQPGFKVDIQVVVDPGHVRNGQVHNVLPDGTVAPAALLQLKGGGVGLVGKGGILLLLGGSGGVDLLQLGNGEGRLGGVFAGVVRVKVAQVGLALLQLGDNQTHLQAPVPQVNVTDGIVAKEPVQPLDALADDGRAQVADVQGLCHVGPAVVHHHGFALAGFDNAEIRGGAHGFQVVLQEGIRQLQVDEAGHDSLHHGVVGGIQLGGHGLGNLDGGALILLGGRQRTVALVFAQVGTVGHRDPAEGGIIAGIGKGLLHFGSDNV